MADSIKQIVDETIETAFGRATLARLVRAELGDFVVAMVDDHVRAGRYARGEYANKGYSTNILPAFFMGDLEKSGDSWRIASTKFNTTVTPGRALIWRWDSDRDAPTAYLVGGYKKFKELAGRDTSIVNLTFTGRMLNSLKWDLDLGRRGARVSVGASGGQQDKAFYTDQQREWLLLFDDELKKASTVSENFIAREVERLSNEIVT